MKLAFLISALLLAASFGSIVEEGGGVIYGKGYAFLLQAPKGWMLDNESGVSQGSHAVFYPKGSSWKKSAVVAYANSRSRTKEIATADDAARFVVEDFQANGSPKYAAKRIKTIESETGATGVIYHFSGDQWGNSEAVVYFVEEKTINYIVLTSRDAKTFAASLDAFEELAKSYSGKLEVEESKAGSRKPKPRKTKK